MATAWFSNVGGAYGRSVTPLDVPGNLFIGRADRKQTVWVGVRMLDLHIFAVLVFFLFVVVMWLVI
jgi:hypothetical protein